MQFRNANLVGNLVQDFASRNEHYHSGARLADSMMWLNRDGGGALGWAFDGQSTACYGRGSASQWTENGAGIGMADYGATAHGGPYVELNGTDEYLDITDAPWQEATTNRLLVWAWFLTDTLGTTQTIAAKWTDAANQRSWRLQMSGTSSLVRWAVNDLGAAIDTIEVSSSLSVTANEWYFACGYFIPSTAIYIAVGATSDAVLTVDEETASVPANVRDDTAPLTIGANSGANFLSGKLGVGLGRIAVPSTAIASHMTRIFHATRWFYQE